MELPAEDFEDIILSSIVRPRTEPTRCRYKARTGPANAYLSQTPSLGPGMQRDLAYVAE